MTRFFLRWLINTISLFVAVSLVQGVTMQPGTNWLSFAWLALIFGFLNAMVRPILKFLTFPIIFLTLGLFTLIINAFMFWLAGSIGSSFHIGYAVAGIWPAILGGLITSLVSMLLTAVFRDELR